MYCTTIGSGNPPDTLAAEASTTCVSALGNCNSFAGYWVVVTLRFVTVLDRKKKVLPDLTPCNPADGSQYDRKRKAAASILRV
jgi:hypothetical protein